MPLDQFAIEKLSPERQQIHRQVTSLGCQFGSVASESIPALIPELLPVFKDWFRGKHTTQRDLQTPAFHVADLGRFSVGVVRSGGRILAFASLVESAGKAEVSIELVRFIANAPTGILDFVLVEAMVWANGQGYRTVNPGLAPLRGLDRRTHRHGGTGSERICTATANTTLISTNCAERRPGLLRAGTRALPAHGPGSL